MASKANGALESIVLNGIRFTCDSETEVEADLSEWDNEILPNSDGTYRIKKTRHMQKLESVTIEVDPSRGDIDTINELKASLTPFSVSATRVDGGIYSGEVIITDETSLNDVENTMELTLEGKIQYIA